MRTEPEILTSLKYPFHYSITGEYSRREVELLQTAMDRFFDAVGVELGSVLAASDLCIKLAAEGGNNFRQPYRMCLSPARLTEWTIVHEMGHALDASYGWKLSQRMRVELGSGFPVRIMHQTFPRWKLFWYRVGSPPPPCGVNDKFNSLEDFAETVTAYVFPETAKRKAEGSGYAYEKWGYRHFYETPRGKFFEKLLDEMKKEAPSI